MKSCKYHTKESFLVLPNDTTSLSDNLLRFRMDLLQNENIDKTKAINDKQE